MRADSRRGGEKKGGWRRFRGDGDGIQWERDADGWAKALKRRGITVGRGRKAELNLPGLEPGMMQWGGGRLSARSRRGGVRGLNRRLGGNREGLQ